VIGQGTKNVTYHVFLLVGMRGIHVGRSKHEKKTSLAKQKPKTLSNKFQVIETNAFPFLKGTKKRGISLYARDIVYQLTKLTFDIYK